MADSNRTHEAATLSNTGDTAGALERADAAWLAGERAQAVSILTELLARDPNAGAVWSRLGAYALEAGDYAAADTALRRAVALMPRDRACWTNLGTALLHLARTEDAVAAYHHVLTIDPAAISARINLGNALVQTGDLDGAVAQLEHVRRLSPESAENLNNLGNLYKDQGRFDDAYDAYYDACRTDPRFRPAFSNLLALTKVSTRHSPSDVFALHRAFAKRFEYEWDADYVPATNLPDPSRRLRLGYVSPDCHTALPTFVEPVLRAHDRDSFEVFVYFNNPQPAAAIARVSPIEPRVMKGFPDSQVAEWIRRDGIDILVDIAGHTGHNRLGVFGRKPAPVQIEWLDYLNTTGLDAMDYRLTDAVCDPPGASEVLHSETLLRLAPTQWCWSPPSPTTSPLPLPATTAGFVTLGSFNNYSKLTGATLALWARLLVAIPSARLVIVGVPQGFAQVRVKKAFGGGTGDRVRMLQRVPADEFRRQVAAVDIALDPLPFSGAATTLESLWQGVPVVTFPRATNVSRSTASLLTALQLSDWIAGSEDDYIAIVERAAADLSRLASLRAGLPGRLAASAVCDAQRFTRKLEDVYRGAWRTWCAVRTTDPCADTSPTAAGAPANPRMCILRRRDERLAAIESAIRGGNGAEVAPAAAALIDEVPHSPTAQRAYLRALTAWGATQPRLVERSFPPAPRPAKPPRISVIICSIHAERFRNVVKSYEARFAGYPLEIIHIPDARSLAEGYNRGAANADGDLLVFCHDDIELVTPDFADRLVHHLSEHDGIGVAGASEAIGPRWGDAGQRAIHGHILHPPPRGRAGALLMMSGLQAPVCTNICLLDGVFIAVRRDLFEAVQFDADRYDGFHLYDLDFTWRASRAGARLAVPADLTLFHASTGRYDPAWRRYARRFVESAGLDPLAAPRPGGLQTRLETLDQINLLRAAMLHFRYGAAVG